MFVFIERCYYFTYYSAQDHYLSLSILSSLALSPSTFGSKRAKFNLQRFAPETLEHLLLVFNI